MSDWRVLRDYPGYSVSYDGKVRNDQTGRILAIGRKRDGYCYVGLMTEGVQVKKSLARLVAETICEPGPEWFDTPIHLDGDKSNCRADNLDWRPRWFAQKYALQFSRPLHRLTRPILDPVTGEVFHDVWDAVTKYGILEFDILKSLVEGTRVFPIRRHFEWARSV